MEQAAGENAWPRVDFFECPLWSQSGEMLSFDQGGVVWQDHEGYVYRFGSRVPEKLDVIFLVYLLFKSKKSLSGQAVRVSRYQVLRDCGLQMNSQYYGRVVESLARWNMVRIDFSGVFYNGKSYRHLNFGVLDGWEIDEDTRYLKVAFSSQFVEMMTGQGLFERIDFSEFKQFRSPLATRLYEALSEELRECDSWEIDAIKLAKRLSMQERYPAHIIPKITVALTRINKLKPLGFQVTRQEIERGQVALLFRRRQQGAVLSEATEVCPKAICIPDDSEAHSLADLLPSGRRQQVPLLDLILSYCVTHGAEYVRRNIFYVNNHQTRNYRSQLSKALHCDLALARLKAAGKAGHDVIGNKDQKAETQGVDVHVVEQSQKPLLLQHELTKCQWIRAHIDSLGARERSNLERKALATLPTSLREIVDQKRPGGKTLLALTMEGVIGVDLDK